MKTAIYIEDGVVQLVLTPESEFEKAVLSSYQDKPLECQVFDGTFYDCRGGWTRQNAYYSDLIGYGLGRSGYNDNSLILRMAVPKGSGHADSTGK